MPASGTEAHFVSLLLSAITLLLGLILWFTKQMWNDQKSANEGFKETFERIWKHLGEKVSEATCQERSSLYKCNIEALESDFRSHAHTKENQLVIRSQK
ncbi:MAG: hypothetical protein LLG06_04170 [Desulfobacteraceae bacterium]|nr:hypothetical protein [Desulfobacteraceae bacterium]